MVVRILQNNCIDEIDKKIFLEYTFFFFLHRLLDQEEQQAKKGRMDTLIDR